jgi:hypothetical protein
MVQPTLKLRSTGRTVGEFRLSEELRFGEGEGWAEGSGAVRRGTHSDSRQAG